MSAPAGGEAPRITGGSPTDEEAAAIAAVFALLSVERAASTAALPSAPTGWARSRAAVRAPWPPRGRWTAPPA